MRIDGKLFMFSAHACVCLAESRGGSADQITRRLSNLDRELCCGLDRQGGTNFSASTAWSGIALHPELADSSRRHAGGKCADWIDQRRSGGLEQSSGSDLVLIASLSNVSGIAYLVTSPKLTSPAQLKGKIIGIDRFGGTGDFILRRTLRKLGLDPDKDVTLRQVGQSPVRLAALQTGSIDATTITVEDKLAAEKFGLKILVDIPKLGIEVLSSGVVTTRSFIKKDEETVRRFMRSIVEGIHYYRTHKAKSIDMMSKYMKVADPRLIESTRIVNSGADADQIDFFIPLNQDFLLVESN